MLPTVSHSPSEPISGYIGRVPCKAYPVFFSEEGGLPVWGLAVSLFSYKIIAKSTVKRAAAPWFMIGQQWGLSARGGAGAGAASALATAAPLLLGHSSVIVDVGDSDWRSRRRSGGAWRRWRGRRPAAYSAGVQPSARSAASCELSVMRSACWAR